MLQKGLETDIFKGLTFLKHQILFLWIGKTVLACRICRDILFAMSLKDLPGLEAGGGASTLFFSILILVATPSLSSSSNISSALVPAL